MITFQLNGINHRVDNINPNTTVLNYLRNHVHIIDTKEGCGSGDCGACTIMVRDMPKDHRVDTDSPSQFYTLNSCITLLSLVHGKALFTASYLADNPTNHPEQAQLHPAQQSLVECHGSQCGYCTPGFVMSLACLYENEHNTNHQTISEPNKTTEHIASTHSKVDKDDVIQAISGNLCRCTGYRPIVDAGIKMFDIDKPSTLKNKFSTDECEFGTNKDEFNSIEAAHPALNHNDNQLFIPTSLDSLDKTLNQHPDAILWAGGTDLGLAVTQQLVDFKTIIQLSEVNALKQWSCADNTLILGAGMTYQQLSPVLKQYIPEFEAILHRIASPQIRNMGTIGGNIANASPIGDLPPILLALDAKIHIRHCADQFCDEIIPLAEFFIAYKQTKLKSGSYVVAIHVPLLSDHQRLVIHKISKRYEDDISACLMAMRIDLDESLTTIVDARIGLGGMAAIPLLATNSQYQLIGSELNVECFKRAADVLSEDVTPLSDVRASREYRMKVVQRLIVQSGKQLVNQYASS